MEISATDVKKLRDRTGMQMMKCKTALVEANGDMEKAVEILRKANKDAVDKSANRETAEGRVAAWIAPDGKLGALLELRCETAPVAKSDLFIALANELAKQVALKEAATPEALLAQACVDAPGKTCNDRIAETIGLLRENIKPARVARFTGLVGSYVHHDGSTGVLLQVEGEKADAQLLRDICMHITAKNPVAGRRDEVPADKIAKETEIAKAQVAAEPKNANKPANIIEKIVEGKVKTWFAENVLVEQPFVKDDSKTIGQLLQAVGLKLVKFARFKVGELA